ncbi:MAG: sulfite reductase [NADPH] flavoprotein alpha-component [Myxococcales bacterium]|nr:sulfite reductase [NADPH] flavoprotein alpha-component [Myxococcales bacterium]
MSAIHILYGTETYNSESLAQRTSDALSQAGYSVEIWDMDDIEPEAFAQLGVVLLITSTFGDGEPPSNAQVLYDYLMAEERAQLTGLQFSVCGLGDTDYEHFCQCGKDFDARLHDLGGSRFAPRVDCDTDYEDTWEHWLETVLQGLPNTDIQLADYSVDMGASGVLDSVVDRHASGSLSGSNKPVASGVFRPSAPIGTRKNPYLATVLANTNLNHSASDKETRHIALNIEAAGIEYRAGDALGVFPRNCPDLVRRILKAVGIERDEAVRADDNWYTIRDMMLYRKDVMQIDRRLVELLSRHAVGDAFGALLNDKKALLDYCGQQHVIDLVEAARVRVPAQDFLATLRPLAPRLYSISSSPEAYPNEIHLTVNVLRYALHDSMRKGVASTFLAERTGPGVEVAVYLQRTRNFLLCADHVPIIMIGPGTGIAPFRAFLQEREARGASGQSWVFFGSLHQSMDFLYRDELLGWDRDGLIARLDLAWSRDQAHKVYVQHKMYENGAAFYRWLDAGAVVYVCGDKTKMAKDVHKTLLRIIQEFGGYSRDDAHAYVSQLESDGRYLRDVY